MNEQETARAPVAHAGLARAAGAGMLVWITAGALFYYRQVFNLLHLGPIDWLKDNHSLAAALGPVWRAVASGQLPGWPAAWAEALVRAGLALLGAGLVLMAAQLFGAGVLAAVSSLRGWGRTPGTGESLDAVEALLFRTACGLGVMAYLFLALAYAGLFTPEIVRGLVLLSAGGAVVWGIRTRRGLRLAAPARWRMRVPRGQSVWAGITLLAGGMSLLAALAPEVEYDALWYHLWLPDLWMESGRPVDLVSEYISLYPLTFDLLFGAAGVLGGPVGAKLLHWVCLPLGALLAGSFIRRFFPGAPAWLAAAVFMTVPTVFWEATTAYIDLALGLYISLALYASLRYLELSSSSSDKTQGAAGLQWLILAALSLGFALAIKHLALFAYVLIVPAVALARWKSARQVRAAVLPVLLLGGASLLIPLPWYVRAWLASGNPFFPDLYPIFGASPPERWSAITEAGLSRFKERFGMGRSLTALLLLPWNASMHAARFGGSLGPVFLLLLPGAMFLPRMAGAVRSRWFWGLLAFCAGYIALWASPYSSFQLRFLVPLALFLAVLAAAVTPRLLALLRLGGLRWVPLQAGLAALLLLNLPPFLSLHEGGRQVYAGWLTHVHHTLPVGVVFGFETQEHYLSRKLPSYQAWKYIHANLPADAYVLTFIGGDQRYTERARLASDATLAHPAVWGGQPGQEAQAVEYLLDLGITHVLVDKNQMDDFSPANVPLLAQDFIPRWLTLEYEDARTAVYALRAGIRSTLWP